MPVLWNPIPTVWQAEGRQYLSTQWFALERGFLSLEYTKSFITRSKPTYALLFNPQRKTTSIFHSYMLYQSPWKDILEWKQSVSLLPRCADTWGMKGELFPNAGSSNTSLQSTHLPPILLESLPLDVFLKSTAVTAFETVITKASSQAFFHTVARIGLSQVAEWLKKNLPANAGDARDAGSIPQSGKPPGVGNGNPLQSSCLGKPVHGVAKSQTWMSDGHARTRTDADSARMYPVNANLIGRLSIQPSMSSAALGIQPAPRGPAGSGSAPTYGLLHRLF